MHNLDFSAIPAFIAQEPPRLQGAWAMGYALTAAIDWLQPAAALEILALHNPGSADRRLRSIATLAPDDDLSVHRAALAVAGKANAQGANILIRPAPLAAHPWVWVDDLPTPRAVALAQQWACLVIETRPGNSQAWLRLDADLRHPERTKIAARLAERLGGDPGAANGSQPGRLPGFKNAKPDAGGAWTNLIADTSRSRPHAPHAALLALAAAAPSAAVLSAAGGGEAPPVPLHVPSCPTSLSPGQRPKAAPPGGNRVDGNNSTTGEANESAREFAFACHRLRAGWPRDRIEAAIASRAAARGKRRNPAQAAAYARQTVQKAAQAVATA